MPGAVKPVSGAYVYPQFQDTFTHRFAITKNPSLQSPNARARRSLGYLVAHRGQPFRNWHTTVFLLIPADFNHEIIVAYKSQTSKQQAASSLLIIRIIMNGRFRV